jgi:thioredoxin 1
MSQANIITLTDDSFEAVVAKSTLPILVDFWAPWCGPCKMIAPYLDEIASDPAYQAKIQIGKVNVDENPLTTAKFAVRGIPTLIILKNGEIVATKAGGISKSQLTAFIDQSI